MINRRIAALVLVVSCASLWTTQSPAAAEPPQALRITDAWTRPAAAGSVGVGYLTILNAGGMSDRLLSVDSAGAASSSLHVTTESDGVMRMNGITGGVGIDAGGRVDFRPGGLHIMFTRLKRAQKLGDALTATLIFEKAGPIKVTFKVATGVPAPEMADMPGMKP
jgi:copper(I)-binding protein